MSLLEKVAILCEAQWNIAPFTVSIDLLLNLSTHEAATLTVDFCYVSLEHRKIFTDIDASHRKLYSRV